MSSSCPQARWVIEGGKMFICCNSHHYRLSSRVEEPNPGLRDLGGSLSGEAGMCDMGDRGLLQRKIAGWQAFCGVLETHKNTEYRRSAGFHWFQPAVIQHLTGAIEGRKDFFWLRIWRVSAPHGRVVSMGARGCCSHFVGQLGGSCKDIFLQGPRRVTHRISQVPLPNISRFP